MTSESKSSKSHGREPNFLLIYFTMIQIYFLRQCSASNHPNRLAIFEGRYTNTLPVKSVSHNNDCCERSDVDLFDGVVR